MSAAEAPRVASVMVRPNRREVIVEPSGELDLVLGESIEREVRELRSVGFEEIVIDLRRLTFMDSAGLRTLLALRSDARRNGERLVLIPGPPAVERIFALTGTRGLFDWRRSARPGASA